MKPGNISVGAVRDEVWTNLIKENAAAYPLPPYGHNPNFRGSGEAAALLIEKLITTSLVKSGDTILSYPDDVLKALRKGLLDAGIHVVVPAKFGKGYRLLNADIIDAGEGSSISGAEKVGVAIKDLPNLTMTFVACVAMTSAGNYIDKGYGFHVPESVLALPSATIVHPLQIVEEPLAERCVGWYATPEMAVEAEGRKQRAEG